MAYRTRSRLFTPGNQNGAEVMGFERTTLVHRREHSPEEAAGY